MHDLEAIAAEAKTHTTRSGVRTHEDLRPLELKSNALTTRPSWFPVRVVSHVDPGCSQRFE